jgi:hypothetical protein
MAEDKHPISKTASDREVEEFLRTVATIPVIRPAGKRGRLMFAMDATASREPTWDRACHIQAQMFEATSALGGLEIQLVYYRGFREFEASPWLSDTSELAKRMTSVFCLGGETQITRVLQHAIEETKRHKVDALVFVGDCMEEDIDRLCSLAGELGLLAVPAFMFHEGDDVVAQRAFRQVAKLTRGAYCHFDASSPQQLRDLLSAVAVYAAGGRRALEDLGQRRGGLVLQLTHDMRKG